MKYTGQHPSGRDKEVPVFEFSMGFVEMKLIHELLVDCRKRMPVITETQIIRHRLWNIIKELNDIIIKYEQNKLEQK